MKKQGSGTVYDRTPAKRGRWQPQSPAYTAKSMPRDIYTKKGDDSSNKEEQSKRKDAGNDAPDPKKCGDDGYDDSSKDDEEKVTNPDNTWTLFQSIRKLTPKCIQAMDNLGQHTLDDLEIIGSATPVDIAILTATTITHVTAMRIAIFSKFLYLWGDLQRNATLSLMARHISKKNRYQ